MPYLITMYWRDIPAQVIGRQGRTVIKHRLAPRFAHAIQRAALRAGRGSSHAYLSDWRRERTGCDGDVHRAALVHVAQLEAAFPDDLLETVIKRAGRRAPADDRAARADEMRCRPATAAMRNCRTIVSSARKEVAIGFDRPFVIIGERINPTRRTALAAEMKTGDLTRVMSDALAQTGAGAHMLDVNAGIPLADEPALLAACIKRIQGATDAPLAIDSSRVDALEAGLAAYKGKALVNSVTAEDEHLNQVLALVRRHGAAVVAICHDETGISADVDVRLAVARKIIHRAADYGIAPCDVVVDPLVLPAGTDCRAAPATLELIRRLRDELNVNTVCGASNFSFGLPNRACLNAGFLGLAIGAGLTAAIANPLDPILMSLVRGTDVAMGRDDECRTWITTYGDHERRRRTRRHV
jgi:5-methyltetrahydrofolate--homocysteine methyltransferase